MTYIVLGLIIIAVVVIIFSALSYAITRAQKLRAKEKIWKRLEAEQESEFQDTRNPEHKYESELDSPD